MAALSNSDFAAAAEPIESLASTSTPESSPSRFCNYPDALCVGDLVDARPAVLTPQTSIRAAVQVMQLQAWSCVVVATGGTILGLFTEQEVLDCVAAGIETTTATIGSAIVPQVPILRPDDSLLTAFQVMQTAHRRYLLVVDDQGQICGLVP
ncbi:MAG: CBS domain-containing protein, partial [Nodosilinea sp.]